MIPHRLHTPAADQTCTETPKDNTRTLRRFFVNFTAEILAFVFLFVAVNGLVFIMDRDFDATYEYQEAAKWHKYKVCVDKIKDKGACYTGSFL